MRRDSSSAERFRPRGVLGWAIVLFMDYSYQYLRKSGNVRLECSITPMTIISLTNARLRPWAWEDAKPLVRHANNRNVSRNLRDVFPYPYTESDAHAWLERVVRVVPITNFVIEVHGEAAGSVGLRLKTDMYRRSAELGYWLGQAHWGRGIATEATRAMIKYGFREFDLIRIEADVIDRNLASVRVLEKAGLTLEGRLRRAVIKDEEILDTLLYAIVVETTAS